jgi:hypothetical protein
MYKGWGYAYPRFNTTGRNHWLSNSSCPRPQTADHSSRETHTVSAQNPLNTPVQKTNSCYYFQSLWTQFGFQPWNSIPDVTYLHTIYLLTHFCVHPSYPLPRRSNKCNICNPLSETTTKEEIFSFDTSCYSCITKIKKIWQTACSGQFTLSKFMSGPQTCIKEILFYTYCVWKIEISNFTALL